MAKKKSISLVDQLREAILQKGLPLNQLAKACGVHRSQLSRFMRSERDLSIEGIERVCAALGLKLLLVKDKTETEEPRQ